MDEHANWDIRIAHEPGDLLARQIDEAERDGYSGIILATPGDIDFKRLNSSSIPLACCGGWPELNQRRKNIVHVNFDCEAHGTTGAKHLLARGRYAVYAFVRSRFDMEWSAKRQNAFVQAIRAAGCNTTCYDLPPGTVQEKDLAELRDWLLALPKPAAVMADCDRRAAQVIAACRDGGIDVPRNVAVLGVDDDAFYALHTRPPLSSVQPGHAEGGYRIAAELDRLIKSRRPFLRPKQVVILPKEWWNANRRVPSAHRLLLYAEPSHSSRYMPWRTSRWATLYGIWDVRVASRNCVSGNHKNRRYPVS